MSDEIGLFNEFSPAKENDILEAPSLDDLYQYISPPLPLFPRNKYTECAARSHIFLENLERFTGIEKNEPQGLPIQTVFAPKLPEISLFSLYNNTKIIYKREPNSLQGKNILNLSNLFKSDYSQPLSFGNIEPYYKPTASDTTLVFESRFESGNLGSAMKVSENEYDLLMQTDINTKGHTQWFYFRVTNTQKTLVKFNILNFSKPDSLYNQGMKILMYSNKENLNSGAGWYREGGNISYFANYIRRAGSQKTYFTLSFTYEFPYIDDTVYIAYCYPYTYSHLMKDLSPIEDLSFVSRKLLCYSIAGNRCEYLTITAPGTPSEVKQRKGAVFTARVHPGETVGSWMMKGLLEFLTSPSESAAKLRKNYVFKIIPMLNPDGVINGNYRCGLAGVDLNRRWKNPSKKLHPTIYSAKKLIKSFAKERKIELICDFHGHSRRKNIFVYGCEVKSAPEETRVFPYMLSKISPHFSYPFCSFRMQKNKQGTMRISLFKETGIAMVYTLEASFCGSDIVRFI